MQKHVRFFEHRIATVELEDESLLTFTTFEKKFRACVSLTTMMKMQGDQ